MTCVGEYIIQVNHIKYLLNCVYAVYVLSSYTVCPTRYRTRHFFNNSNTNEHNVRCVRNEKERVCSVCL